MLIWVVGVAVIVLLVIADVRLMRPRKSPLQKAEWPRMKKKSRRTTPGSAKLKDATQVKQERVYNSFSELFVALNGKDHKELFVVAEDQRIPDSYRQVDH